MIKLLCYFLPYAIIYNIDNIWESKKLFWDFTMNDRFGVPWTQKGGFTKGVLQKQFLYVCFLYVCSAREKNI